MGFAWLNFLTYPVLLRSILLETAAFASYLMVLLVLLGLSVECSKREGKMEWVLHRR